LARWVETIDNADGGGFDGPGGSGLGLAEAKRKNKDQYSDQITHRAALSFSGA
jgi:hypothetical protein